MVFAYNKFMTTKLSSDEIEVLEHGATEPPFSGQYNNFFGIGTYLCKKCGRPLFHSSHKFHSFCGWPSFDDEIPGSLVRKPDPDGIRTEILCADCGSHLGHLFSGEGFTTKNIRYCVNSIAMNFIPEGDGEKKEDG